MAKLTATVDGDFREKMRAIAARVNAATVKRIQGTSLTLTHALIMGTPVDTGKARGNWQVTLDSPATDVLDIRSADEAFSEAQTVIAEYQLGQSIEIVNNVPYIIAINNGHSKKVPVGWIEAALANVSTLGVSATFTESPDGG